MTGKTELAFSETNCQLLVNIRIDLQFEFDVEVRKFIGFRINSAS